MNDLNAARKTLTFAQAEGRDPLPRQLERTELPQSLRSMLWHIVHTSLEGARARRPHSMAGYGYYLTDRWAAVLRRKHVYFDHKFIDEFKNDYVSLAAGLKQVFAHGDYITVLGLLQWLLRQPEKCLPADVIRKALRRERAAFRLLDDDQTLLPIALEEEAIAVNSAFSDLTSAGFHGAKAHLSSAARFLTDGKAADSIRESIHAVESVARV